MTKHSQKETVGNYILNAIKANYILKRKPWEINILKRELWQVNFLYAMKSKVHQNTTITEDLVYTWIIHCDTKMSMLAQDCLAWDPRPSLLPIPHQLMLTA